MEKKIEASKVEVFLAKVDSWHSIIVEKEILAY